VGPVSYGGQTKKGSRRGIDGRLSALAESNRSHDVLEEVFDGYRNVFSFKFSHAYELVRVVVGGSAFAVAATVLMCVSYRIKPYE
jgi:hypothetical protein